MEKIRFIHTADIHLGSFLHIGGKIPNHIQKIVRTATMDAFRRICDVAIEYNVDFIAISGFIRPGGQISISFTVFCRRM